MEDLSQAALTQQMFDAVREFNPQVNVMSRNSASWLSWILAVLGNSTPATFVLSVLGSSLLVEYTSSLRLFTAPAAHVGCWAWWCPGRCDLSGKK